MTQHDKGIDALRQSMVEQLMRVIGLPDDEEVAREADEVLATLDTKMREADNQAAAA